MEPKARLHLIITGRVQGVFFRLKAEEKARQLGLVGWAKNNQAGNVEIMAEGEVAKLKELYAWCHHGSDLARVEKIYEKWLDYQDEFKDFNVVS